MPSAWIKVKIQDLEKLKYSWGQVDQDAVLSLASISPSVGASRQITQLSDWQLIFSVQGLGLSQLKFPQRSFPRFGS